MENPVKDHEIETGAEADFIGSELTHFSDFDVVLELIRSFCSVDWQSAWKAKWEWLVMVISKYQEQPTLLSPYLEALVSPMYNRLLGLMESFGAFEQSSLINFQVGTSDREQFNALCKTLQLLCRVRGYKHVVKLFPHEVSHIEPCMLMLRGQDTKDFGNWETRYILMLWLCVLCIIPFDICSMDSSMSTNSTTDGVMLSAVPTRATNGSSGTLVQQIIAMCLEYMSDAGPTRDAASACLSTLLTRPDMESDVLKDFISSAVTILREWSLKTDAQVKDLTTSSFQLVGILHCLSQIFKKGHRHNILPYAWIILAPCLAISTQSNQTLTRKLLVKLFQRLGLTFLPPRVATWRYQRGSRSLVRNMKQSGLVVSGTYADAGELPASIADVSEDDVPDELEDIIDRLLTSLRDPDTVVRWSAAKGVGRVTERLPQIFGDDVIVALLELFSDKDDDSAWHGGCLALAELSRRGLLLPERLGSVFPIVSTAMQFDVLRGQHSVGAHVRDAACYVCWAFARAYSPVIIRPFVRELADAMIVVALFDREVNCRRAASAAFQENVGRQGMENFPLGIEITAIADYFSLGIRSTAFLEVAPAVAKLSPEFSATIINHLCQSKICHWDSNIRLLAARAMGKLTSVSPDLVCDSLMRIVPSGITSTSLAARHGAVLLAAEVILSLSIIGAIPAAVAEEVSQIVIKLDKARMYRGRGAEILREVSCKLIENVARAQLPLASKTQVALLDAVNENLKQPHEVVQLAASNALRQLLHFYFAAPIGSPAFEKLQNMTVGKYLSGIEAAENVALTRGYSLALGALPHTILSHPTELFYKVLETLSKVLNPTHLVAGEPDADTRRNAVSAVVELGERLAVAVFQRGGLLSLNEDPDVSSHRCAHLCISILLKACDDYSVDKRGDTGSWSRILAIRGLERLVYAYLRSSVIYPHDLSSAVFNNVKRVPTVLSAHTVKDLPTAGAVSAVDPISVGDHVWTSFGHGLVTELNETIETAKISYPAQSMGSEMFSNKGCVMRIRKLIVINKACVTTEKLNDQLPPSEERNLLMLPPVSVCSAAENIPLIDEKEISEFVCVILKQLGEKLDAVRGVAGPILLRVLESLDPIVHCIPDRKLLIKCLSKQIDGSLSINWKQSSLVFPFLCELLESDIYFHWIVSGLVISVGGLTEAIVKDSAKALLRWCRREKKDGHLRSIARLATSILLLFRDYSKCDRVILPLLKTLQLLLQNAIFDDIYAESSFREDLILHLKVELNKCSEIRKIRGVADILIFLARAPEPSRTTSLRMMLTLLGHQFPQVRKYVAEQLYMLFIEEHEGHESLLELLMSTIWDRNIEVARDAREKIALSLGITLNLKQKNREAGSNSKVASDELDSYEALVREAGY